MCTFYTYHVYLAVAGEGLAALFVTGEGTDKARVFDLFVEVADKAATGKVEDATSLRGRISCSLVVGRLQDCLFIKTSKMVTFGHHNAKGDLRTPQNLLLFFVEDRYVVVFRWFA